MAQSKIQNVCQTTPLSSFAPKYPSLRYAFSPSCCNGLSWGRQNLLMNLHSKLIKICIFTSPGKRQSRRKPDSRERRRNGNFGNPTPRKNGRIFGMKIFVNKLERAVSFSLKSTILGIVNYSTKNIYATPDRTKVFILPVFRFSHGSSFQFRIGSSQYCTSMLRAKFIFLYILYTGCL